MTLRDQTSTHKQSAQDNTYMSAEHNIQVLQRKRHTHLLQSDWPTLLIRHATITIECQVGEALECSYADSQQLIQMWGFIYFAVVESVHAKPYYIWHSGPFLMWPPLPPRWSGHKEGLSLIRGDVYTKLWGVTHQGDQSSGILSKPLGFDFNSLRPVWRPYI